MRIPEAVRKDWQVPALAIAGIVALYATTLTAGFINDDYLFLEQTRRHGIWGALTHASGLANYFRPLSREVWFGFLAPLAGGEPLLFHVAQLVVFIAALALLADLLAAFVPAHRLVAPPVLAGVTWYALLPFQRVNLTWVSCSQDLLALVGVLAALAWFRRGRLVPALLAYAAATLAKESALPLPAALFVWAWRVDGASPRDALRRVAPFAVAALPWAAGEWLLRQHAIAPAPLDFRADHLAATFVHMAQSLAGVEHASGWLSSWTAARPSALAFALLAVAARWLPDRADFTPTAREPGTTRAPGKRGAIAFAVAWLGAFTVPVWPVVYLWSSYYYTLAAVGGALLVTLLAARIARWSWIALAGALVWWHAAGVSAPAFGLDKNPWLGTSHFTPFYLERAAALSKQLRASLTRSLPKVGEGTRFFFASIPSWAGFQTGNGPNIRQLYHDDSIESYFYSEFGERTAARQPCEFLFWDGGDFARLHTLTNDPFFQVGTDLLLLEKPAGAAWAFRRGLDAGGARVDHLYWLGWALLWDGKRELAERAWREWGAHDDTSARVLWLRKAKGSLEDRDTLTARRQLVEAVRCGVGHPEAHAMLGLLLARVNAKYALLETRVAAELNPHDWLARRDLVSGLLAVQLDEPAARQFEQLKAILPDWRRDSVAVRLEQTLAARRAPASVAVFGIGALR